MPFKLSETPDRVLVNVKSTHPTKVFHLGESCCSMTRHYPEAYRPVDLGVALATGKRACRKQDSIS